MLRSSAGNFYNYFRPGAGELIRSTEPRRFLFLSPLPFPSPFPSRHRSPPYHRLPFFFPLSLPAPSSRLSNHARLFVVHRLPFLSVPFFSSPASPPLFSPAARNRFSVSRAIVPRAASFSRVLASAVRMESKHLGRISLAVISFVRYYSNYRSAPVRSRSVETANFWATISRMKLGIGHCIPRRAKPFSGSLWISRGMKPKNNVRQTEILASLQKLRL